MTYRLTSWYYKSSLFCDQRRQAALTPSFEITWPAPKPKATTVLRLWICTNGSLLTKQNIKLTFRNLILLSFSTLLLPSYCGEKFPAWGGGLRVQISHWCSSTRGKSKTVPKRNPLPFLTLNHFCPILFLSCCVSTTTTTTTTERI